MPVAYAIPQPSEPVLDQNGHFTVPWQNYLRTRYGDAAASEIIAELEAQISDLLARVEALEEGGSARIVGPQSVSVVGSLENGLVQLTLVNDEDAPQDSFMYSVNDGEKGWNPLYPDWVPNPYAIYLTDEDGNYLTDEAGRFMVSDTGYPINPDFLPDHNQVNGLQGGNSTERYHLTAAQHTELSAILAAAPVNVTGSRGGNAALASLLTALATIGIITDSTTA